MPVRQWSAGFFENIIPYTMETIFWTSVVLFVIALGSVVAIVIKHRKMFGKDQDIPARYEDVELSERPFVEFFN